MGAIPAKCSKIEVFARRAQILEEKPQDREDAQVHFQPGPVVPGTWDLRLRLLALARRPKAPSIPRSRGGKGTSPVLHWHADAALQLHRTGVPIFSSERARAAAEPPEVHLGTPNHE